MFPLQVPLSLPATAPLPPPPPRWLWTRIRRQLPLGKVARVGGSGSHMWSCWWPPQRWWAAVRRIDC
eukprot:541917-Prorocentrum_minimum.AAC.1